MGWRWEGQRRNRLRGTQRVGVRTPGERTRARARTRTHRHTHTQTNIRDKNKRQRPFPHIPPPPNVVIPPSDCSLAPDPKASCQCPEPRDRLLSATSRASWKLIRVSRSPMGRAWWLRLCSLGLGVPLSRSLIRGCHLQLPGALGFCEHVPGTTGGRGGWAVSGRGSRPPIPFITIILGDLVGFLWKMTLAPTRVDEP